MNTKSIGSTTVLLSSLIGILTACGAKKQQPTTEADYDQDAFMVETAVNSVGSLADDASGQATASAESIASKTLDVSSASCSGVAALATCDQGARHASYNGCVVPFSNGVTAQGNVQLNYSDASCSLQTPGTSVSRTFDMTYSKNGFRVIVTSAQRADYRGQSYGGGGSLNRTSAGWTVAQGGRHTQLIGPAGVARLDLSVRTLQPIDVTGSLSRTSRLVNSGELEINHNLAKKSVVYSFNNLQYSQQCCYPVSGSITRTGDYGNGTVEFLSCGQARLTTTEGTRDISLSTCE